MRENTESARLKAENIQRTQSAGKLKNAENVKIQKIEKEESEIWKKFDLNVTTARVPCRRL